MVPAMSSVIPRPQYPNQGPNICLQSRLRWSVLKGAMLLFWLIDLRSSILITLCLIYDVKAASSQIRATALVNFV